MSHEIHVYFTHVELTNYTMGECRLLEKYHSVFDKVYHKVYPKGMYYEESTKTLMLPRGIDIDRLQWMLGEQCPVRVIQDSDPYSRMNTQLNIKYTPRDDKQKEAIKFIMGMGQYQYTFSHSMLSLNLNTGVGKTYCAISSLALLGYRCFIITDSTNCIEQWYNFFQEYTDIQESDICWITPNNIRRVLASGKKYSVYLGIHATIRAYSKVVGWRGIGDIFKQLEIGIKVFDESHLDLDNMFLIDCHTNTLKTLYLTATPKRSHFFENKVFSEYFNGVPFIDLFDKEEDPHTAYAAYRFNSGPAPYQISNCMGAYGLNKVKYIEYIITRQNFHMLLHIIFQQAIKKEGKSLWFIGTNNAIDFIKHWLWTNYPEYYDCIGVFNGLIPKELRRVELEKKIILTNTKSAGAAVDIPGLSEVVMLAEPIKSRVLAQQTFGRCRADNTIYKDIVDTGFHQLNSYYNFKKPVFRKYATECKDVKIGQRDLEDRTRKILMERRDLYTPFFVTLDNGAVIGKYRYPFTPADISIEQLMKENVIPDENE